MNFEEKLKQLPSTPGVYLMKDSFNTIIYVGKSKNLKSRVSSYFQNSNSHSPKVLKLVNHLKDFDYILTDTEFEALILECQLIHKFKPFYNRVMKNTKSYSYLKIKLLEDYPYILLSAPPLKDTDGLYLGPFTNKNKVITAIEGIKEYFKLLCTNHSTSDSYCLNYSLGLCRGFCLKTDEQENYADLFNQIISCLNGEDQSILSDIKFQMNTASLNLDFEKAIKYRDYLNAIQYLIAKAQAIAYMKDNKSIAAVEYLNNATFKFFLIKGSNIIFKEVYQITNLNSEIIKALLKRTIKDYFNNLPNTPLEIGPEEINESQIIYGYLTSEKNKLKSIVILEAWLTDHDDITLDKEINNLLILEP